jgi:hypothetical protein
VQVDVAAEVVISASPLSGQVETSVVVVWPARSTARPLARPGWMRPTVGGPLDVLGEDDLDVLLGMAAVGRHGARPGKGCQVAMVLSPTSSSS